MKRIIRRARPKPTAQLPHVLVAPSIHTRRVLAAYYKYPGKFGDDGEKIPSGGARCLDYIIDDKEYIALVDGGHALAIYRIRRHDQLLKRLRRPPKEFDILHPAEDVELEYEYYDAEEDDGVGTSLPAPPARLSLPEPVE